MHVPFVRRPAAGSVRLAAALTASLALFSLFTTLPARAGEEFERGGPNVKPAWLGALRTTVYDGVSDDLLTAGLGKTALGGATPAITDVTSAAQLRRLAIFINYRAILDITPAGGYGRLYGPNIDVNGNDTLGEGRIAGTETLAYADADPDGGANVTMMVQVPASFDPKKACIVTAASSGSRGVYGAIGSAGEWGLKHGCAVAYTDKGTGNGIHDLAANTVSGIDGVRADAVSADGAANFRAPLTEAQRLAFNAAFPNRVAVKHAHSGRNPERNWGRDTLNAVRFAFYVLNEQFGTVPTSTDRHGNDGLKRRTITPRNTVVIASSVSNGAGAALAAAEQDDDGLIDGVAVSEPNVQLDTRRDPVVRRAGAPDYSGGSKALYDYFSFANLFQPCAALSTRAAASPQPLPAAFVPLAGLRCASLAARGLLAGTTTTAQAEEALDKLLAYGWEPESILLQVSHWRFATPSIVMTYANAYGRFGVTDNLCGFSFAATDAALFTPVAWNAVQAALSFGTGNGVPPTATLGIVNNNSVGGARLDLLSVSPSNNLADFNLDGALCQRTLWTGNDANARQVQRGVAQVQRSADLHGKPALIVQGRNDTLLPVNFNSRPYYARNLQVEGRHSRLSYIEVTNAQHFDAFLPFAGYDTTLVPLHVYFNQVMDAMYAHLTLGAPLPPSQVVRTTPRGGTPGAAPPITAAQLPAISAAPASGDRITFDGRTLVIP